MLQLSEGGVLDRIPCLRDERMACEESANMLRKMAGTSTQEFGFLDLVLPLISWMTLGMLSSCPLFSMPVKWGCECTYLPKLL